MTTGQPLSERIRAEFQAREQRVSQATQTREAEAKARDERLKRFSQVCDQLRGVWRPRLEEFAKQFGQEIKVTPNITPTQREAKVVFLTDLATMTLTLTVSPNPEVTSLIIGCDLLIIPMFFEYERHARLEMPLDKPDPEAIGRWIDDRLIACVKAYLSMKDNDFYLQRAMVEDPISKARFLRADAAATIEHKGQTHYFASTETLKQYKSKQQIAD